jgi:hypothetical protein
MRTPLSKLGKPVTIGFILVWTPGMACSFAENRTLLEYEISLLKPSENHTP